MVKSLFYLLALTAAVATAATPETVPQDANREFSILSSSAIARDIDKRSYGATIGIAQPDEQTVLVDFPKRNGSVTVSRITGAQVLHHDSSTGCCILRLPSAGLYMVKAVSGEIRTARVIRISP